VPRHVHPRQTAPVTETKINSEPDQMRRERPGLAVRMHPPDLGRQLRSLDRMVTGWAAAGSKLT